MVMVVVSVVRWVVEWSTRLDRSGACRSTLDWQSDDDTVAVRICVGYRQHSTSAMAAAPVTVICIERLLVDDGECQLMVLEHFVLKIIINLHIFERI